MYFGSSKQFGLVMAGKSRAETVEAPGLPRSTMIDRAQMWAKWVGMSLEVWEYLVRWRKRTVAREKLCQSAQMFVLARVRVEDSWFDRVGLAVWRAVRHSWRAVQALGAVGP